MAGSGRRSPPGAAAVGADAPGVAAVGADAPGVAAVGADAPGVAAVGADAPGVAAVGADAPGVAAVGADAPGVAAVGADAPGAASVSGDATALLKRIVRDGERDLVAIEEPLEIRVAGEPLAVTMRTPGHDEELALGFLYGEGLIAGPVPVGLTADLAANTIEVDAELLRSPSSRRFYTTSSCGVCGKGALAEVAVHAPAPPVGPPSPVLARTLLAGLPERLVQPGFARSGGLHATGLFDAAGEPLCVREDVGRHNAMDKVIGWALRQRLTPLTALVLCVSGRLSFELVQKATVAGAPILVGVGAPTSLAVELAAERGMTLCGFARRGAMNVYSGGERVTAGG